MLFDRLLGKKTRQRLARRHRKALTHEVLEARSLLAAVTMTFEGVGNFQQVGNFYNGGAGGNHGVSFTNALAIVDSDVGGSGNISNEPSPSTVVDLYPSTPMVVNTVGGFRGSVAFHHANPGVVPTVNVWSGPNGTGSLLASQVLPLTSNGPGDPSGAYRLTDAPVSIPFSGTARSFTISASPDFFVLDNLTLDLSDTNIFIDGSGNLVVQDAAGGVSHDNLNISYSGGSIIIHDPTQTLGTTVGTLSGDGHTVTVPVGLVTGAKVILDMQGGNDFATIDSSIANSGKNVDYHAAGGNDGLKLTGTGGASSANYTPSVTTQGDGSILINSAVTVLFTGLEPVDITGFGTATVSSPVSIANTLTASAGFDSATGAIPAIVVTGNTNAGATLIESAHLYSNTTVVLDTSATTGSNTITSSGFALGHNNTNLTLKANALGIVSFNTAATNITGALNVQGGVANVNQAINIGGAPNSITGTVPLVNVSLPGQIQDGIDMAAASGTVNVAAGTYNEDLNVHKIGLHLLGASAATTTVIGPIGGGGSTVAVTASNVEVAGFTITRAGNNTTDWNNAGLNSAGISVQNAPTNMLIRDNIITGMRTAIDVNNSSNHTVRNNVITQNRTGLIFRNQTDNITFVENEVTDNFTVGILFLDASGGTNSPVQTALNSNFSNNNISGNWYGQIVDRQVGGALPAAGTNLKNFSNNWFGTDSPVISSANSAEPGYAAQIPVAYGGTATPPGGQPDILGPAVANFDITPYLHTGADTNVETTPGRGTFGFQGDFSSLHATAQLAQTGAITRIQEAINRVTAGGTVHVDDGDYVENVIVNKQVEIAGQSQTGVVVMPALADPDFDAGGSLGGGASNVFLVQANNVTISNLTVDGDNPALTSGVVRGGFDIDARNGIITNHNAGVFNNLEVHDVTVRNIYLRGIYASSGGTFNFHHNTVRNVRGSGGSIAMFNFGGSGVFAENYVSDVNDGIAANHSSGTQFLDNVVIDANSGIHTDNNGSGGVGVADLIQGNTVTSGSLAGGSYGIWVFAAYKPVVVEQNIVLGVDVGLGAFGAFAPVDITFGDNVVNLEGRTDSLGIWISTTLFGFGSANMSAVLTGNIVGEAGTGIYAEQEPGFTTAIKVVDTIVTANVTGIDFDDVSTVELTRATIIGNTSGGSIDNATTLSLTTDAGDDTIDLNSPDNQFSADAIQPISFSGVTTFNVDAAAGEDTVNVKAHSTTVFNLTGNAPATLPGDTLHYLNDGTPYAWYPTKIVTTGKADINFNTFETYTSAGGPTTIVASANDDVLEVIATGPDSGTWQLTTGGVPGPIVSFSGMTSLTFNGLAGSDRLIIDHPTNGAFAVPVTYNGGNSVGESDDLVILDGSFDLITNTFTGVDSGAITFDPTGPAAAFTVSYSGLEPVLLNVGTVNDVVFNLPAGADAAIIEDDGTLANNMSQIRSAGGTFEVTAFTHPTSSLTVTGGAGDSIQVNTADSFTANINLSGVDSISIAALNTIGSANWQATNSISQTGAFTVGSNISLQTTGVNAPVTLFSAGNQIGGEITLNATGNAQLRDSLGSMVFYLTNVGGNLTVEATGGNIQQTGVLFTITGTSSFTTTQNDADIILNNLSPTNDFVGAVSLFTTGSGGDASISDRNALNIGTSNVGGALLATAQNGNLVSSGLATAGASVTFQASAAITDGNGDLVTNVSAPLLVTQSGTGTDLDTNVTDLSATNTASNRIQIDETNGINFVVLQNQTQFTNSAVRVHAAAGNITQSAAINVQDNVEFKAFAGDVLLFNAGNQIFGEITLTSFGNAQIRDSLGAMVFYLTSVGGNLLVEATGGDILQTGTFFTIDGTSSFTTTLNNADIVLNNLDPSNDFIGAVSLFTTGPSGNASISDRNAINIGVSNVGGFLFAHALAGNLTSSATATAGTRVTFQASAAIVDASATPNIIAPAAELIAVTGMGLETQVAQLAALNSTSGHIVVNNTTGALLTIASVNGTVGVNNNGPGTVNVTNNGGITVSANSSAGSSFILNSLESAASGENIVVNGGVTIQSDGTIDFNAGDNFDIQPGATLAATGVVTLDSLDTAADALGSTFDFFGNVDAADIQFTGAAQNDLFNIQLDNIPPLTHMFVDGKAPSFPTLPGDTLKIFAIGNPTLTVNGVGTGQWNGLNQATLDYIDIETVTSAGPYHLAIDMGAPGLTGYNSVDARLDDVSGANLELRVDTDLDARDGTLAFQGPVVNLPQIILSLTVLGSNDTEAFSVTQNALNQLPGQTGGLNGANPAFPLAVNQSFVDAGRTPNASQPPIKFFGNGAGDADIFRFNLNLAEDVGYFASGAGSGAANVQGKLTVTFAGNEFVDVNQMAVGGSIVVDSSSHSALSVMAITDTTDAPANVLGAVTQVDGNAGFADARFKNFASVLIRSGLGQDLIDLISINPVGLTNVTLDSDSVQNSDVNSPVTATTADDTVRLRSLPATASALLKGSPGRDTYQLYDANLSVDNILGPVTVGTIIPLIDAPNEVGNNLASDIAHDQDRLIIIDSGSTNLAGAIVNVTETTVDGLTGFGGIDVTYSNTDYLDVTATSGPDHIYVNMANGISDLNTATVRGSEGRDLFDIIPGVENFVPTLPANQSALQMQKFTDLFLFGDGPDLNTHGDIFGYDDFIRPSKSVIINIDGGAPSVVAPPGNFPAVPVDQLPYQLSNDAPSYDRLNLNMARGGAPQTDVIADNKTPVVVDTIGGTATSQSHTIIKFREIEYFNVWDKDGPTNVQRGDLYVRASEGVDSLTLYPHIAYTSGSPNGFTFQALLIRYNNKDIGPYYQTNASVTSPGKWIVYGRQGNDKITVNNWLVRDTEILGGAGNDYIAASTAGGEDLLIGGWGNDRLQGLASDDVIYGDRFPEQLAVPGQNPFRPGRPELSTDPGTAGIDTINGGNGNDILDGGGGNDKAYGENGDDIVYGGAGNDTLGGDRGFDILMGGAGNDRMNGGHERDILIGGMNVDTVDGDQDQDIVVGDASNWDTHTFDTDIALLALMFGPTVPVPGSDYWSNLATSYTQRTMDGSYLQAQLNANIIDDTSIDTLVGDLDLDWYFDVVVKNDKYSGKVAAEKVN